MGGKQGNPMGPPRGLVVNGAPWAHGGMLAVQRMQRIDIKADGTAHAPPEWECERPEGNDFADHSELALRLGGRPLLLLLRLVLLLFPKSLD